MISKRTTTVLGLVLVAVLTFTSILEGATADRPIRLAVNNIQGIESLYLLIALEHLRERGVDVEVIAFKQEDLSNQAVINGQADIGSGTPYAVIQNLDAPVRIFYQRSKLQFFPVVNAEYYGDWQDLQGEKIAVHSRSSGTEAMAKIMSLKHNIEYDRISYVPGSDVRALSMLNGNIKAAYLNLLYTRFLMKEAPGKFKVLPSGNALASDETLFARQEFLDANPELVDVIVEELIRVWRAGNENQQYLVDERERLGLLSNLPDHLETELLPYYEALAQNSTHPVNGGGEPAAHADLEFFTTSGQLQGSPEDMNVEDFWDLRPLNRVLDKLGKM